MVIWKMPWTLDAITSDGSRASAEQRGRGTFQVLRRLTFPRRIQALFAVILTIFVFATTILFLGPENRPAPINDFIESPPWQPYWTTEQLEPKFAYAQYATSLDYLCNAVCSIRNLKETISTNCFVFKVINFGRLRRYGAKEDLVLIHPKGWLEGVS